MAERIVCTYCGRDGHRASRCPVRPSRIAGAVAALILAPSAVVRAVASINPDALVAGVSILAGAAGLYLILGA